MSEVNHSVSQALKGIVELTDALEAKQQASKLIFPSKDSLNGEKAFFIKVPFEKPLASTLESFSSTRIFRNIRDHSKIEDGFPVRSAIISRI